MSPKKGSKRKRQTRKPKPAQKAIKMPKATGPDLSAQEPLTITYENPKAIREMGFLIPASINVPDALHSKIMSAGRLPPRPVEGYMIVDTGASMTSLCKSAIRKLNLHPITSRKTHSVHGTEETHVYYVKAKVGPGDHSLFKEGQFAEVNLEGGIIERYEKHGISIIGLLGRDYFEGKILICDFIKGVMTIRWS